MSIAWMLASSSATARDVKRIDIMETQARDLAQCFDVDTAQTPIEKPKRDDEARSDEAELEKLCDRVSAARSVY
jgi:hypothetical protein